MKGILADVNIQGYVDYLMARLRAEPWQLFWNDLKLPYLHFSDVSLDPKSSDALVWETCQQRELLLITDNRNQDDSASLEATIRLRNAANCLPVLTIGNIQHLRHSHDYTERVVEKLLDTLHRIDALRGTGRLFLP